MAIGDKRYIIDMIKDMDGTGSGLDADFVRGLPADFTSRLADSGYQKLPNGLIIQWGLTGVVPAGDYVNIILPISYPNQALVGLATNLGAGGNYGGCNVTLRSNSQIIVGHYNGGNNSSRIFWLTIGY